MPSIEAIEAIEARIAAARRAGAPGRPFVTLSYAQSLDGCIARRAGEALALSGRQSLEMTHRLRAAHDAVLVGIGTLLSDDPRLSARPAGPQHNPSRQPRPLLVDTHLRCPPDARALHGPGRAWIAAGEPADRARVAVLQAAGAEVLCLPLDETGRVDLRALLQRLGAQGVERVMVEGGAQIITSFLARRLVDHAVVTIVPLFVGGLHAPAAPLPLPRLRQPCYEQLEDDPVVSGALDWGDA